MSKRDLLVGKTREIISQYSTRLTLRQIFYRLVAGHVIPNTQNEYNALSKILVNARLAGEIPFDVIEDRTREFDIGAVYRVSDYLLAYHPYLENEARDPEQYYEDAETFHRSCWQHFRLPRWKDQPKHVEVWLEKQALSALFQQVTKELEVPFAACRGYPSLTYLHEGSQRLRSVDKERIILYFGDYDPSGEDIQRAIGDRLKDLASTSHVDIRKIAITRDQIQQYQIPPMPTKAKDPRRNRFVAQHGDVAVELDALDPLVLQNLIRESVEAQFDQETYLKIKQEEAQAKQRIKELCSKM